MYFSQALQGWLLTRYQDVLAAFRDSRLSSRLTSSYGQQLPPAILERLGPVLRNLASWVIFSDRPEHTRLRGLLNKAFTPRMTENLRPRIQALVDELLDAVAPAGRMDVIADLANPLPVIVIGEMMGLPREDRHLLKAWSDMLVGFLGAARQTPEMFEAAVRGITSMEDYLRQVIAERRKRPGEDLISQLLAAEEQGAVLNEQELLSTCSLVLFGGHETTTNLIGNAVHALLEHPDQWEALRREPGAVVSAVEEVLRFDSPVQRQIRLAAEDVEVGGQRIPKGQAVVLMIGSANRDPAQFPEPDRMDVLRKENRHLTFGMGAHFCLGAPLGRLEAQLALGAVLRRFPSLKRASGTPHRVENLSLRGFESLPVLLA
ncbi:cytochrome P450 [Archangium sp.]|uniref:cytochrome P450 n=1 Tax=Archangium sp. TaxID=1872627 RepID=UPI002D638FDA|nr:cytochrome P450 [Archangium sp.]HYO51484.1 cytochrome P450 [Archangium sp.]